MSINTMIISTPILSLTKTALYVGKSDKKDVISSDDIISRQGNNFLFFHFLFKGYCLHISVSLFNEKS